MSDSKQGSAAPKFAVRISRGLVTHWQDNPLMTWGEAEDCRAAIFDFTNERGEIEKVIYAPVSPALKGETR